MAGRHKTELLDSSSTNLWIGTNFLFSHYQDSKLVFEVPYFLKLEEEVDKDISVWWDNQDWVNPMFHNTIIYMKHDSVIGLFLDT